jgi:ferrous iron transport protein B
MIIGLIGNQNCGKTALFNQLTGAKQRVGNFPGVTVEQKIGPVKGKMGIEVVDLPGIYSLRPYTSEEIVTRDFILNEKPDAIINIVDVTNIERNLYLTLQLLEMRIPMVLALNMMDELRNNGGSVDIAKMSALLGIPVVPISAIKNEGIAELMQITAKTAETKALPRQIDYCPPGPIHRCIHAVAHLIEDHAEQADIPTRFAAIKMIENDPAIASRLALNQNELESIEHIIVEMETELGLDRNAAIAEMRYNFIESVSRATVKRSNESKEYLRSVRIDKIMTNKYLGIPIFLLIMLAVFMLTFNVIGAYLSDLLAAGIDWLTTVVDNALTAYGLNPLVQSLIIDGIFAGVGSVLSFLPIIVTLFFFLSILEDTGYIARVVFVMDKLLRKIGLSGRSIVPMLLGFGCSVPAIMATRTLPSERDRKLSILLVPFMSCSAKIPIYAVFASAFFSTHRALVMMGLYVGGAALGILIIWLLGRTAFRGQPVPFVLELPNYRFPSMKSVLLLMWERARDFMHRAFTVILMATIVVWMLQTFDIRLNPVADSSDSLLALGGRLITPLFAPLGLADWRITTSLISGLIAKEAVVSTLGVLMNTGVEQLGTVLGQLFTPATAIGFLVFTLLYTPCVAAIAAVRRELGSRAKTVAVIIAQCGVAWLCALIAKLVFGLIL